MKLLTPDEVGEQLRLPAASVVNGSLRRQLPWLKLAGKLRLTQDALDQFVTEAANSALENSARTSKQQSQAAPKVYAPTPLEVPSGRGRPRGRRVYKPGPE